MTPTFAPPTKAIMTARCEARIGERITDSGFVPTYCHQERGLRFAGDHAYCPAPGHRLRVEAQVRRGFTPPDRRPEWVRRAEAGRLPVKVLS